MTELQALLVIVLVTTVTYQHTIRDPVACPLTAQLTQDILVGSFSLALLGL